VPPGSTPELTWPSDLQSKAQGRMKKVRRAKDLSVLCGGAELKADPTGLRSRPQTPKPESTEPSLAIAPAKKTKESKRVTRELAEEAAAANPAPTSVAAGEDASAGAADGSAEAAAPAPGVEGEEKKSKKKRKAAPETEAGASKPVEGKKAKKAEAKKPEPVAEPSVKIKKRKPTGALPRPCQ
jgi:hypothetical protein